jgi:endonuclease IV
MYFPFKIGLKLYSTDTHLIPAVKELNIRDLFDYIELYAVPKSYKRNINKWRDLDVYYIIHAPHMAHNVNIANKELMYNNLEVYKEVKEYCNTLNSACIIVHGGSNGTLEETIRQLRKINDHRIRIENKPMIGLGGEMCRGCTPEEFKEIFESGVVNGMVLDFNHAIYASVSLGLDHRSIIKGFMEFAPTIFHLSDGKYSSQTDIHLNFGKGEFNLNELLQNVPRGGMVTIETPKSSQNGLREFKQDVQYLKNIFSHQHYL